MLQLQAAGIEAIEFGRDEYGQSIRQVKAGIEFAQQARERLRRRRRGIADLGKSRREPAPLAAGVGQFPFCSGDVHTIGHGDPLPRTAPTALQQWLCQQQGDQREQQQSPCEQPGILEAQAPARLDAFA